MTKQDIARIYGMYIGCEVKCMDERKYSYNRIYKLAGVVNDTLYLAALRNELFEFPITKASLHLYSLEDISDEHLQMLADEFDAKWCKLDGNFLQIINEDDTVKHHFIVNHWNLPYPIADKFREWGYAIPYNGHDLFTPLPDGTVVAIRRTK